MPSSGETTASFSSVQTHKTSSNWTLIRSPTFESSVILHRTLLHIGGLVRSLIPARQPTAGPRASPRTSRPASSQVEVKLVRKGWWDVGGNEKGVRDPGPPLLAEREGGDRAMRTVQRCGENKLSRLVLLLSWLLSDSSSSPGSYPFLLAWLLLDLVAPTPTRRFVSQSNRLQRDSSSLHLGGHQDTASSQAAAMGRSSPAVLLAAMAMLVVAVSGGGIKYREEDLSSEEALWALYERWSAEYKVEHDVEEKVRRFNIFKQNARHVHDFNQGNAGYTLDLNMFGDMTNKEVNEIYYNPYLNHEAQHLAHAKALQYLMNLYYTLASFAFLFTLFTFCCNFVVQCRPEKKERRLCEKVALVLLLCTCNYV